MISIITHRDIYCIFVGGNEIGTEGAKAIADALLKNQALTQLNLSHLYHYTLRYLFIFVGNNEIGAEGAIIIQNVCKKCTRVKINY